ncbi:Carboxylesterase [Vibrio aerogenes CECT 7868]|uniref:Carboxylic ester hydrolase n=1 Tax=Vibrio aerogenes CECT 7868 TaxID=1216006 RepID=A0A1M5UXC5_9VIBR|nr:carboxylesterase family protein [Vibrio aerogenes]SHH67661.1 Carboxylesterase [Vibrio aerogenes CECT 7868]
MKLKVLLISLISLCCTVPAQSATTNMKTEVSKKEVSTTVVNTALGQVKGVVENGIAEFRSVPYAVNPFEGTRRFQAPEKVQPWHGVLDATRYKAPVPQPDRGKETVLLGAPGDLTLNILAPVKTAKKLPVMVWIPGGAFIRENASDAMYRGESFVRDGVIVVTVNYRVGIDGFMHIPGAPDNRGILDQIAALEWVQSHIASFGGDPEQVTLAGQSAGAECVAILSGIPRTKGLFRRVIMQSSPVQTVTLAQSERVAQTVGKLLGIKPTTENLARVPFAELVKAVVQTGKEIKDRSQWGMMSWGGTAFLPVIDQSLLTGTLTGNLAHHADPSVSVLIGSTEQESRLYLVPNGQIDKVHMSDSLQLIHDLNMDADIIKTYKKGNPTVGDVYAALLSDYTFRMPTQHIAQTLVNHGNAVWVYDFAWRSPAFNNRLGAAHLVDVPFAFDTTEAPKSKVFLGDHPPQSLIRDMHTTWVRFIQTGQAGWSVYQSQERRVMRFDGQSAEVKDPGKAIRLLWESYPF